MQKIARGISVATRRHRSKAIMSMVQRKKEASRPGNQPGFTSKKPGKSPRTGA
jgi:hypothetical protein